MAKTNNSIHPKRLVATFVAASTLCLAVPGSAETVQVPVGQQAKQKQDIERPITGMQQSQVEALFGKPIDWSEAVGEPPISSWIYPEFVVYFEYDYVLHSVLKHSAQPVASRQNSEE